MNDRMAESNKDLLMKRLVATVSFVRNPLPFAASLL